MVVGAAGLPDDLKTWHGWVGRLARALTGNVGRWVLAGIGFVLLLLLLISDDRFRGLVARWQQPSGYGGHIPRGRGQGQWPEGWVEPQLLAEYLTSMEGSMPKRRIAPDTTVRPERRSFAETVNIAAQAKADLYAGRLQRRGLQADGRDALRSLIREGEGFNDLDRNPDAVNAWAQRVGSWLGPALGDSAVRRFERFPPDSLSASDLHTRRLETLRVLLLENIPPGITHELTPLETIDRYMEIRNVPYEERGALRERALEIMEEVENDRLGESDASP